MSSFRSSTRRGIAAASLIGVFALGITACGGNSSPSTSSACGDGSGSGNVSKCFDIGGLGKEDGTDATIPAGTSVKIVCKDSNSVGIIVPDGMKNGDADKAEWTTKGGTLAARGIGTEYFKSIPGGLTDCDKVLTKR